VSDETFAREFDCVDCRRHIVAFGPDTMGYCAACLCLPGWFNDPELCRRIDPDWQRSSPL